MLQESPRSPSPSPSPSMAAEPETLEGIETQSHPMTSSRSRSAPDALSEFSSSAAISSVEDLPDPDPLLNSSPSPIPAGDDENQSLVALRSEEYRQLFRLPAEEVLIEDFNCACQDNILLQGHMYLFLHYICFYSNIFGFETKKTIPLFEVRSVKRAKTAGIFPNAIEITAGGKKHFFGSFLSRDEAFKLINEIWLLHGNGAEAYAEQETPSESSSQNIRFDVFGSFKSFRSTIEESGSVEQKRPELGSADRDDDSTSIPDPEIRRTVEDGTASTVLPELDMKDNVEQDANPVVNAGSSASGKTWTWKERSSESPKIPQFFTMVAESKFPIKVKDFFSLFFSDDSFDFIESFHERCGDKDFKCTSWSPDDQYGYTRKVEFQHPIKIYFGARYGSCNEVQKFCVYKNSHLVLKTWQEISDVPYGDYFRVEVHWDLKRDGDESRECCHLQVYVNVAFSKSTVFKGKIVQSTIEECREVYGIWISMAHELLQKNNLEKQEDNGSAANTKAIGKVQFSREAKPEESLERPHESRNGLGAQLPGTMDVNQVGNLMQGDRTESNPIASVPKLKFWSSLKTQSHLSPLLIITFAVIILMQMSILMLLARPQKVYVVSPTGYVNDVGTGIAERSTDVMVQLEKRINHLKDDILSVETQLDRMCHEHATLKAQLEDLGNNMNRD